MNNVSKNPFLGAGVALVVCGVVDIFIMIYCISNKIAYSSSLNILSLAAGVYLVRGSVRAAKNIRSLSAFILSVLAGAVLIYPVSVPVEIAIVQLEKSSWYSWVYLAMIIAVIGFVYKRLSSVDSIKRFEEHGFETKPPYKSVAVGIGVLVVGLVVSKLIQSSDIANSAAEIARSQLGNDYNYYVSSFSMSDDHGSAKVIAYKDGEIKELNVNW